MAWAELIRCPTLVCEADADPFWPGQPEQLFAALTCPKTLLRFSAAEGAGHHCHVGAHTLFHQRAFDWPDDTLGWTGSTPVNVLPAGSPYSSRTMWID